jgi:hypothetical protein
LAVRNTVAGGIRRLTISKRAAQTQDLKGQIYD